MRTSVFPKMLAALSADELADFVRSIGIDGCNAVVRDGFWTPEARLAEALPPFVDSLRGRGLEIPQAETDWDPRDIVEKREARSGVALLKENGITAIRLRQLNSGGKFGGIGDVIAEMKVARAFFLLLERIAADLGVQFVYQVHHRTLLASASSLQPMIADLDPRRVGAQLDGGNMVMEGMENWRKACRLLGKHLAAFSIKDGRWVRSESFDSEDPRKGWKCEFVPCMEGVINWQEVGEGLRDVGFDGPLVFMPFYKGIQDDLGKLRETLIAEREYLARWLP